MSDEELIDAMAKIKKHCAKSLYADKCVDVCVFFNKDTRNCLLECDAPCDWEYPQGDYDLPIYKEDCEGE